jgi:hypothetical protein
MNAVTRCPRCSGEMWIVPNASTLIHHVLPELWPRVKALLDHAEKVLFCPQVGCPIVYHHAALEVTITEAEVRTRIGYKVVEPPVPVCYCIGVLAATIRDEILVRRCCDSIEEIKKYTGARTGKLCHVTNPSGRCCGSLVRQVVDAAIAERADAETAAAARSAAVAIPDE